MRFDDRIRIRVGVVRGVDFGRLEVRTGLTDPAHHDTVYRFLDQRVKDQDLATLLQIREHGKEGLLRAFNDAFGAKAAGTPIGRSGPLIPTLRSWVEGNPTSKTRKPLKRTTVASYKEAITALGKVAHDGATVNALPDVILAYLKHCEEHGQNFPYMRSRTMALSFARATTGVDSWLYRELSKTPTMHSERKRDRLTIEPRELRRIMARMTKAGNGHLAQHVWNMALMAFRPDEYSQLDRDTPTELEWLKNGRAIFVKRGKTKSARRYIPRFVGVKPAPNILCKMTGRRGRVAKGEEGKQEFYGLNTFRKAFTQACNGKYELYDLRATGLKYWEWCGISERCVQIFAGHKPSVTQGYRSNGDHYRDWKRDIDLAHKKMNKWLTSEGVLKKKVKTTA